MVLSEFFVVTQEEDGIFQGQSVVKVTLGLAFCCALHLERAQKTSERVIAHTSALNEFHIVILWTDASPFLLPVQVSPSPARPGSCPGSRLTACPPQTWSPHGSSDSNWKAKSQRTREGCFISMPLSCKIVHSLETGFPS